MYKWVIRLEGGLGNQLFQYAHARALQKKYGGELYLDLHAFTKKQTRSLSLHHFCIQECKNISMLGFMDFMSLKLKQILHHAIALKMQKKSVAVDRRMYEKLVRLGVYIQYQTTTFESFIHPSNKINYLSGNYLTPGFFEGVEDVLKDEFLLKRTLTAESSKMLEKIKSCNSVCVHVRLGDYISPEWKSKLFVCTEEYYQRGMDLIKIKVSNPVFFVFSNSHNDIELIKKNYHFEGDIVYVDLSNPDYADFSLMCNCKHFIMSNSTFSWWSQWLGNYSGKIVVAPSKFNNVPEWDMSDIYLKDWLQITI